MSTIADLLKDPGPFASTYANVNRDTDDAIHSAELRARAVSDDLRTQGAPDAVADTVHQRLVENPQVPNPISRCIVATENGILLDSLSPIERTHPVVCWDRLPEISAWLADGADGATFVLALVDHRGGEVGTYRSKQHQPVTTADVGGPSQWENKVRGGAWSHRNIQRRTENIWARSSDEVISEIDRQLDHDVDLLFIGGEPDARRRIVESGQDWRVEMIELEHAGRDLNADNEALVTDVAENLATRATARRLAHVHDLRERMGQGRGAVTGVREVTDALVRGQVERLLVDPEAVADTTVDPTAHPGIDLDAVDTDAPLAAGRLLIALAGRTGADTVITTARTMAGAPAAALLRW